MLLRGAGRARGRDFTKRVLGFRVSDWIEDVFVFMRCNPDHHVVNFVRGKHTNLHHFAFQLRDFSHLENGCDVLRRTASRSSWGPLPPRPRPQRVDLSTAIPISR